MKINILSGKYERTPIANIDKIMNAHVKYVKSKGKFMYIVFDNNMVLMNSFGLVGEWTTDMTNSSRLEFIYGSGTYEKKVYFNDGMNYGNVSIGTMTDLDKKLATLAPDVLQSPYTDDEFIIRFCEYRDGHNSRKKMMIVKVLMDQSAIYSGIGNYLVAEILYNAKISPRRILSEFSDGDIVKLNMAIINITKECYECKNKDLAYDYKVYRKKKDPLGNDVFEDKILNGRKTHWVKNVQM